MTQVQLADTFAYACKKTGKTYDLPLSKWSQDVLAQVIAAGIGRYMTDVHASAKDKAEADALIVKKIDALNRGEVRAPRESTADPVDVEARKLGVQLAKDDEGFKEWLRDSKLKATEGDGLKAFVALAKQYEALPETRAQAEENVAKRAALPKVKIDFSKLLTKAA